MLTLKLKLKNLDCNFADIIKNIQQNYSYAFRKLYMHYFDNNYKELSKWIEKEFNLNSWFIHTLQNEVETKQNQTKTVKNQLETKIISLHNTISKLEAKQSLNKKEKQTLYKLHKKLKESNKSLSNNLVFGGKGNLKKISKLSNKEQTSNIIKQLNETKLKFHNQRIIPLSSLGQANSNGNRFFQFNKNDLNIIFKPNKKVHLNIEYFASKSQIKTLNKLKNAMKECSQPISFKLSTEYIWISYDEQFLNGFAFDKTQWSKELNKHPKTNEPSNKELRSFITKEFYKEQEQRQLKNKITNRCIAVDLNPQYIGYSICDYNKQGIQTIISAGCFDLKQLNSKLKLSSSDLKQIKQNNKRIHEINHIWKQIFKIATHFKCAYFIQEDLNFKSNLINTNSNEANRQTKNLWHRTRTINLIKKHINQLGIQLIEVNPCYTSYIGNLQYNYYDPTNASLEINRRGANKYIKGQFYPEFNLNTALDAMSNINRNINVRDVLTVQALKENSTSLEEGIQTWLVFYRLTKQMELKYRRCLEGLVFKQFSMNHIKSKVYLYSFV